MSASGEGPRKVTMLNIAREAGVSLGTVSRVFRDKEGDIRISPKTRQRVLDVAARLGYQQNPFATALRKQQTGVIGAVVRDIADPFLLKLFRAIQDEALKQDLNIFLGHAESQIDLARRIVGLMKSYWFDGIVLLGNMPQLDELSHDLSLFRPCVAVACGNRQPIPSIGSDEKRGVTLAMQYLMSLGHRRIGCIGNAQHAGVRERYETFRSICTENNLEVRDDWARDSIRTRSEAITASIAMLQGGQGPTAIFCTSDELALGAMSGVWKAGLRVPENVSIMGYDDIDESATNLVPLTTIRQNVEQMARIVIEQLATVIRSKDLADAQAHTVVPPELVVRASCAPPSA